MYHSITFGNKNTYDDWKLVPETRPVVNPPEPKFIFDEIPGANGSLDLSSSLTGFVNYQDRTGSFNFIVLNDYEEWQNRYSEIMNYLHGQRMTMILEDDPNYYYIGRFSVSSWDSGENWSTITIDYQVDPFKYSNTENHISLQLTGTGSTLPISGIKYPMFPRIRTTRSLTMTINGEYTRSLSPNVDYNDIPFYPDRQDGIVHIVVSHTEVVATSILHIYYREVKL